MSEVQDLIRRAESFRIEHPKQARFASRFVEMVQQIEREFQGETRQALLNDAGETLARQIELAGQAERALAALSELQVQQLEMLETLERLTLLRPKHSSVH